MAYDHGDDSGALDGYLGILERAARGEAGQGGDAVSIPSASAARVELLLAQVPDRTRQEDRVLALPRTRLPWQVQAALAEAGDGIARRRGDATLLARGARAAGCIESVRLLGVVGRLVHGDLESSRPPSGEARTLTASGCRLIVPALDGRAGVRALAATLEIAAPGGDRTLVLDHAGSARLRVDSGPWHRHGSDVVAGPRWSAARVRLSPGRHLVEIRLGGYGQSVEMQLLSAEVPGAADGFDGTPIPVPDDRTSRVADALAADLVGDVDRALVRATELARLRRDPGALAVAAAIFSRDVTRPATMARDSARALHRRAVDLDPGLARARRELAILDLIGDRSKEALDQAEAAVRAAPRWWPALLTLADALRARGFERDSDLALDRALALVEAGDAASGCTVREAAYRRAQQRNLLTEEARRAAAVAACDARSEIPVERLRQQGDLAGVELALTRQAGLAVDPLYLATEIAGVRLARGRAREAVVDLEALRRLWPRDPGIRVRLADALTATGDRAGAGVVLAEAAATFPTRIEPRQAARSFGLPSPLDPFRLHGKDVIRDFEASGRRYDAPAILVLDRTVTRVFGDGAHVTLTHNIVKVVSKDGIERWGEVQIPEGAEVLSLRTHKPDGSVREPEEIAGKPTISAPELAPGDYVEWETLEYRDAPEAFAPGFLGERFYFQSVEVPLDRSEYWLCAPADLKLDVDRRAGGPVATSEPGPDGTRVYKFETRQLPQLFAERAAVPGIEWIPSVRLSVGVTVAQWSRFLGDQLVGVARSSPALREAATAIAAGVRGDRAALARAVVDWVSQHVEAEGDVMEPATFALARGRGNRTALIVALARHAGLRADVMFVRSRLTAAADAVSSPQELDDYADVLVHFPDLPGGGVFVDPRLRHAPFGYLPPALDGAPGFTAGGAFTHARSAAADHRSVTATVRLDDRGGAQVTMNEVVTGWPSIEWADLLDHTGGDQTKLRQEFEQRWLAQHFPGAQLTALAIEPIDGASGGTRLAYSFTHSQLAVRADGELKLSPSFFRSQPGRRYATEDVRRTAALVGFDVPLDLDMHIELPPGARVIDAGPSLQIVAGRNASIRFVERRSLDASGKLSLRRQWRLPILHVAPSEYPALALQLRRIDPVEQAEIRIQLAR